MYTKHFIKIKMIKFSMDTVKHQIDFNRNVLRRLFDFGPWIDDWEVIHLTSNQLERIESILKPKREGL